MERAVYIHGTSQLKLYSEGKETASLSFLTEKEAHDWTTENFPEAVFEFECATFFGLLKSNGPGVGGTQVIPVFEN